MPDYPSEAPNADLSQAFVSRIPDPERLVYDYVKAASTGTLPPGAPALGIYADQARQLSEGRRIDVGMGWPAFPGKVPAIGVAVGDEGEDPAEAMIQGGYLGEVQAFDDTTGKITGQASYYGEPLYVPVQVILIHENRDERNRLHNQLRLVLTPLRTWLPTQDPLVKRVTVDLHKDEASSAGPPVSAKPFLIYMSIATVHVYCEMQVPREIVTASQLLGRIDIATSPPAVRAVYSLPWDSR